MKENLWLLATLLTVFAAGVLIGWYLTIQQQHKERIAAIDKLKRDLAAKHADERIERLM